MRFFFCTCSHSFAEKGRMKFYCSYTVYSRFASRISVALWAAVLQFPAFLSCTKEAAPAAYPILLKSGAQAPEESVDLFLFSASGDMRLDSYQHCDGTVPDILYGMSSGSESHVLAIANYTGDIYQWASLTTFPQFRRSFVFSMERDNPLAPLMTGEAHAAAGKERKVEVQLKPLLCAVKLNSVCFRPYGRPYTSASLNVSSAFLMNAGLESRPLDGSDGALVTYINQGGLDSTALKRLPKREMLARKLNLDVGPDLLYPGTTLYCYPNPATGEDLGQPLTSLVLECVMDGRKCYYSIPLPGMQRGRIYSLNLRIRRMGAPSADTAGLSGDVEVFTSIAGWEEFPKREITL